MESQASSALSPPMPFSALLFDCDGTLVDTLQAYEHAWTKAFGAHGMTMAPSWYRERTGLSPEALVEAAAGEAEELDAEAIQSTAIQHFVELVELVKGNERVVAVARAHHGSIPMGVVSGGPRVAVQAALERAGILDLFDALVTIEDVDQGKPAPDLYLLALNRLNMEPAECVAYEDTDEGVAAARSAGIRCIDVRPILNPTRHHAGDH
jgi:beta-phosphoglucomutase-like phosphatase (HAD superfamily)